MNTTEFLDKLDQVHANGTADGVWRFVDHRDRFGPDNRYEILDDEGSVAVCSDDNDATQTTGLQRVDLIVAAVNALPHLTAALRAVEALCAAQPVHEGFATVVRVADIRAALVAALEAS